MEKRVIYPKGTILEWAENLTGFHAKKGAKVELVEDYTTDSEFVRVKFLDDLSNGQEDGGYDMSRFNGKSIINDAPTVQCSDITTFNKVREVIDILVNLDNGYGVDGETMGYILKQVGMEDQMLKQLSK